jgi:crossover junction endodeoxyribonuclease RuvC
MKILGIDPGTQRVGYGVIQKEGQRLSYVAAGLLSITAKCDVETLPEVYAGVRKLIKKYSPDYVVCEKLFFSANRKTGVAVAQARGAVISAAASCGKRVFEYAPNEIKLMVAGYGNADKKAVSKMVGLLLGVKTKGIIDDATDALAAAICGAKESVCRTPAGGVDKKSP